MTSSMRQRLASLTTRSPSSGDVSLQQETEKYKLKVTAGPSYDETTHETVHVNSNTCTVVENAFVKAKINVRIRSFHGLPSSAPAHCSYFDDPVHDKDQYSVAFSFVPKQDLPALHTVWGNDFDHPIRDRLPPGFNTAFRIVKEFIDPGLNCDAYADEPWLYGPSLSCWFAFRIGEHVDLDKGQDFPAPSEAVIMTDGADGSGQEVRQNLTLPENNQARRKFFLSEHNRQKFTFEKGRLYQGDFYNPYIDFGNFALKLPGFTLKVIKYVDQKSHCLRYVFKNRETNDVYFNINFHLLWGQKLEAAMMEDEKQNALPNQRASDANSGGSNDVDVRKTNDESGQAGSNVSNNTCHVTSSVLDSMPQEKQHSATKDMPVENSPTNIATEVSSKLSTANPAEAPVRSDKPATTKAPVHTNEIAVLLQETSTDDRIGQLTDITQN
nr:upf0590 protein [Quercus suber]